MISINFASRNYPFIARIVQALIAASVVLALLSAGLVWKSSLLRGELRDLNRKLAEAEAADGQVKPALIERDRLVKDLNAMSGLLTARTFSWTRMLTRLEEAVPIGVALTSVVFNPKDRTIVLQGTAHSPESLRNLVVGLEQSQAFSEPYLKHQSLEKGTIEFNVVAVYHEQKSTGLARRQR